jgi:pimeloyl-ACP methyl ester carboxylesterase
MATFVIVPGAWGGAWSWNRFVVPKLRARGHEVFAVTLTGLGDRSHRAPPGIDLDTHIQDVVNVLFYEDLRGAILAGHSYGGNVITGVADRCPERLRQLVYLDAATPADGQAPADATGRRDELERRLREGDWRNPPGTPPPDQPAEITDWARPRRHGHPIKTLLQPLKLTRGETTLPRAYVYCTVGKEPGSHQARRAEHVRNDPRWSYVELNTGHNLHYTAPDETVRILDEIARA